MKRDMILITIVSLLALTAASSRADVLHVAPSQAVVLPSDNSDQTRVALLFDLTGIRSGEGRRIDEAILLWSTDNVTDAGHSEFRANAVTSSWTAQGASGGIPLAAAEAEAAFWEFEPLDHDRNDGGLVRLDLTSLIQAWLAGTTANHGVVISSADFEGNDLAQELANVRLIVRYGFIR